MAFLGRGLRTGKFLGIPCETVVVKEAANATTHFVTKV